MTSNSTGRDPVGTSMPSVSQIRCRSDPDGYFVSDLVNSDLGDEDFINDVQNWKDTELTKKKKSFYKNFDKIFKSDQRRPN